MNYLLDTHALIWSIMDAQKLSKKARQVLENPENTILASAVNFWEISLKFSIGKLELQEVLPHEFPQLAVDTGFELLTLTPEESASYFQLKGIWHRDPFDRMLIWQAIQQNLVLISKDKAMREYGDQGLKTVW